MTRFSVVTVVRNDAPGFRRTRDSLQAQTCLDWEWLVADGGSDDGTAQVVSESAALATWWRSRPDRGPYDGMNDGLDRAGGTHVVFLNAGDRFAGPRTLETLARAITASEGATDLIYGDALEEAPDGGLFLRPARDHRWAALGMFAHHPSICYARRAVAGLRFPLAHRVAADYAFTLSALRVGGGVRRLREPLSIVAPPGLSARLAALGRIEQDRIRADVLDLPFAARAAIRLGQRAAWTLRTTAPAVYGVLRGRRAVDASGDEDRAQTPWSN